MKGHARRERCSLLHLSHCCNLKMGMPCLRRQGRKMLIGISASMAAPSEAASGRDDKGPRISNSKPSPNASTRYAPLRVLAENWKTPSSATSPITTGTPSLSSGQKPRTKFSKSSAAFLHLLNQSVHWFYPFPFSSAPRLALSRRALTLEGEGSRPFPPSSSFLPPAAKIRACGKATGSTGEGLASGGPASSSFGRCAST